MKHLLKATFLFLTLIIFIGNTRAESKKIKFGKISKEELEMKVYEQDSSASAVILYDSGRSYFIYESTKPNSGFKLIYERHVRIKVLKPEGLNYANFEIPLYNKSLSEEKVTMLKARSYNLEGKINVSKMEKNSVFHEKTSKNWITTKFAIPNVKVGSVIECKYSIKSSYFRNLRSWQFQYPIPVASSNYTVRIPEYFTYQQTLKGYSPIKTIKDGGKRESFDVKQNRLTNTGLGWEEVEFTLDPTTYTFTYKGNSIPAFKQEHNMLSSENYISEVEFELESYCFPYSKVQNISSSWESVQDILIKDEDFGLILKQDNYVDDVFSELSLDTLSKEVKMKTIFQLVKNNIKWNKKERLFCTKNLKKTWNEKIGNSSEINLCLVSMLRKAGIEANPIALSTRDNGIIHPSHASISQLNYVIACATIDNKRYLMDATNPFLPINILPTRCLNGRGRLISENKSEWVNLTPKKGSKINIKANLKINEEGNLTGQIKEIYSDYEALNKRTEIAGNSDNYSENLNSTFEDWNISDINYTNVNNLNKPLIISYNVDIEDKISIEDKIIYFNPVIKFKRQTNPFKLEKRTYPVDLGYPQYINYFLLVEIPQNYQLKTQVKPSLIKLADNGGSYSCAIKQVNNKLMINNKFNISQTQFSPEEYSTIKEFFNHIISKEKQIIVLEKQLQL